MPSFNLSIDSACCWYMDRGRRGWTGSGWWWQVYIRHKQRRGKTETKERPRVRYRLRNKTRIFWRQNYGWKWRECSRKPEFVLRLKASTSIGSAVRSAAFTLIPAAITRLALSRLLSLSISLDLKWLAVHLSSLHPCFTPSGQVLRWSLWLYVCVSESYYSYYPCLSCFLWKVWATGSG